MAASLQLAQAGPALAVSVDRRVTGRAGGPARSQVSVTPAGPGAAAAAPRIARARPARAVRRERDRQKADGTTERTENNHQKTEQTYYMVKRRAAEPRPALHPPRFPASFVSQL